MADKLANTFGTELDRVHCPFYFKIGACRFGDQCSRKHTKPTFSQTVLLSHMYANPLAFDGAQRFSAEVLQTHFDDFFEDVFTELSKFGVILEMNVCDNICEHLFGNVYVMFRDEDAASDCVSKINGRMFSGRPVTAELSPVTDFSDARCRQYDKDECQRGGMCNFMHLKQVSPELRRKLFPRSHRDHGHGHDRDRHHGYSDRDRDRGYHSSSHHKNDRDRDRDRDRDKDKDRRRGDGGGSSGSGGSGDNTSRDNEGSDLKRKIDESTIPTTGDESDDGSRKKREREHGDSPGSRRKGEDDEDGDDEEDRNRRRGRERDRDEEKGKKRGKYSSSPSPPRRRNDD